MWKAGVIPLSLNPRTMARFLGLNETHGPNEETFEKVMDLAVLQKGRNKPK
jgi:hypothetical protein